MANYLKSQYQVNQAYAAACIEKMLIRKSLADSSKTVMNESNVDQTLLTKLLQNLCELLAAQKDLYAMRCLLRVIQLTKHNLVPFAPTLGSVLASFITEVCKDEKNASPNFIYILFEASALTLTYVKDDRTAFSAVED